MRRTPNGQVERMRQAALLGWETCPGTQNTDPHRRNYVQLEKLGEGTYATVYKVGLRHSRPSCFVTLAHWSYRAAREQRRKSSR